MTDTGSMTPRTQLGFELRNVVVEHVEVTRMSTTDLATEMNVDSAAIDSMLLKEYWDVELGLELVGRLRIPFRVVLGE